TVTGVQTCALPISSRDLLTRMTDAVLTATSTRNPAVSSRICPMARLRMASGDTTISRRTERNFDSPRMDNLQGNRNAGTGDWFRELGSFSGEMQPARRVAKISCPAGLCGFYCETNRPDTAR